MIKKIKVLDLFAGSQSVKKALDSNLYDVVSIDIFEPNLIFDLSQKNIVSRLSFLLLQKKQIGWKPDFIWASPPCTTFSRATCIKQGTLSFEVFEKSLQLRTNWDIEHKIYKKIAQTENFQKKHIELGIKALKMLTNTIEIVLHFESPFIIENPAPAISKYLLETHFYKNIANYCQYGFSYKKTTALYSNEKFSLKKCDHKKHKEVMSGKKTTEYKLVSNKNYERSKVPGSLILEILHQLRKKYDDIQL